MKKSVIFFLLIFFLAQIFFLPVYSQKPVLMLPEGHTGYIYSITYSPDGKTVLTASADKTAKRWDVKTGKLLNSYEDHPDMVEAAGYSPDGKFIYTACEDDSVRVWQSHTGELLFSFYGIYPVFSHDGKSIAVTNSDKNILILDVQNGKLLRTLKGHKDWVRSIRFSYDNMEIITASDDNTAKIWNSQTGKLIFSLKGHTNRVLLGEFSPDGKTIITGSEDNTAKIWDAQTGKLLNTLSDAVNKVVIASFSRDGSKILTATGDKTLKIWERNGNLLSTLAGHKYAIENASFSPDGKNIISADWAYTNIWDSNEGRILKTLQGSHAAYSPDGSTFINQQSETMNVRDAHNFDLLSVMEGHSGHLYSTFFSPSGRNFLTISQDNKARIWDSGKGKILNVLDNAGYDAIYSPDGNTIATTSGNYTIKLWDAQNAKLKDSLPGNTDFIWSLNFSRDGKKLVSSSDDRTAKIWDVTSGELVYSLVHEDQIMDAIFSPDGKSILTGTGGTTVSLFDLNGKLIFCQTDINSPINSNSFSPDCRYIALGSEDNVASISEIITGEISKSFEKSSYHETYWVGYSPDGERIVTISEDGTTDLWDAESQKLLYALNRNSEDYCPAIFSPDGKTLITTSAGKIGSMWDTESGKLIQSFDLHNGTIEDISWSDSLLVSVFNSKITFYSLKNGKELLSVVAIDENDWIVSHPSGLFDASQGALDKMYYVQGDDIIELNQLKERYYEPGLWEKVMGSNKEPLRNVAGFEKISSAPAVNLSISNDVLDITLENRGGGIGKFQVFINGKEVLTGNTPESETKFRGGAVLKSTFNLRGHPYLLPGKENEISVKAFNEENYLTSRGEAIKYSGNSNVLTEKPRLFLVSIGISDYTGDGLDLKYAAKDAEDMAKALNLGASNLFGAEKTITFKLTTDEADKMNWPTKENIKNAFASISKDAKAYDVLVVYLSGHGINWGGQDGDFYYLTQDAFSGNGDVYNDPVIRGKTTLSSAELTELIKSVAALKEVLIIDACASGRAVENLMEKRDVSSSALRALDRMKDRTGLHIITGCAADAVSYEVSRFGQGVLTYSLLEGIKGASLREERFVDVVKLFQYSAERVPQLAEGIGGIQQPRIFSPFGESSFDIGEIRGSDKVLIRLAKAKPMVLMSSLKDKDSFDDDLGIEKLVDEKLRDLSSDPVSSQFIFIEANEFPDSYRIRGAYSTSGNITEVTVNIFLGSKKAGNFVIKGEKTKLGPLTDAIVEKARESIKQ